MRRRGGTIWRAYNLKEAFRAIFAGDLDPDDAAKLIDRWISKASRSGIDAFVTVARTIRKHRDGILAALKLGINNGRAEGLNNVVRLITRRAFGFHSAEPSRVSYPLPFLGRMARCRTSMIMRRGPKRSVWSGTMSRITRRSGRP
ncbi:transposase [Haloechinothrix alba]|uniref:transposase n=1 Tax=Haloechinothrix alba TaxID=664784 RepID=UPI000B793AA4